MDILYHISLLSCWNRAIPVLRAGLVLVFTENRDLWEGPAPEIRKITDFPSLCACTESNKSDFLRIRNDYSVHVGDC